MVPLGAVEVQAFWPLLVVARFCFFLFAVMLSRAGTLEVVPLIHVLGWFVFSMETTCQNKNKKLSMKLDFSNHSLVQIMAKNISLALI